MAEGQEDRSKEDLTEEASPYRLEENRRKGIVSQSKEITGLLVLCAAAAAAYAMGPASGAMIVDYLRDGLNADAGARLDLAKPGALGDVFARGLRILAAIGLPISIAGFLAGVVGSVAQFGGVWSGDPVTPDFTRVDPLKGLKRLFSLRSLVEGVRLTFKVAAVGAVAYGLVKSEVLGSVAHWGQDPATILAAFGPIALAMTAALAGVLAVFSGMDFWLQRSEYMKGLRMTKQEAKQEHREREGDPNIKARVRAVQREMARRRMMNSVKKADVIVTNPTHIAVAISYDKVKMGAPKVVAKGADYMAQKIKAIAADAGVPMVENVALARTLFKSVKVGHAVPRALYQAVAEVLAYVYRLKGRHGL